MTWHEPPLWSGQFICSPILKFWIWNTYDKWRPWSTSLELTCSAWTHSSRSCQRCSAGRVRPPPDYNGISWMWMWISGRVRPPPDDDVDMMVTRTRSWRIGGSRSARSSISGPRNDNIEGDWKEKSQTINFHFLFLFHEVFKRFLFQAKINEMFWNECIILITRNIVLSSDKKFASFSFCLKNMFYFSLTIWWHNVNVFFYHQKERQKRPYFRFWSTPTNGSIYNF